MEDLSSSYGIGFKLLKKMGFSEGKGLGREDNQGITRPIETVILPKQVGLGYTGKHETSTQQQQTTHKYTETRHNIALLISKAEEAEKKALKEEMTIHALSMENKATAEAANILTQFSQDSSSCLLHLQRIKAIISSPESDFHSKILDNLISLSDLTAKISQTGVAIYSIPTLNSSVSKRSVSSLPQLLSRMLSAVSSALLALFFPFYSDLLSNNDIFDFDLFYPHIPIFSQLESISSHFKENIYFDLIQRSWIPKISSLIDMHDFGALSEAVEFWWPVLPLDTKDHFLSIVLCPKIKRLLKQSPSSLSNVALPWVAFYTSFHEPAFFEFSVLCCRALVDTYNNLTVDNIDSFQDWKPILHERAYSEIVVPFLYSSLSVLLESDFSVNPKSQNLDPVECLFAWAECIPRSTLLSLCSIFFKKLHSYLYLWLTSSPDYVQVRDWYFGWKSLLPQDITSEPHIRHQFRKSLDMMNDLADNPSLPLCYFVK